VLLESSAVGLDRSIRLMTEIVRLFVVCHLKREQMLLKMKFLLNNKVKKNAM
jgi:hypothetical protein